MCKNKIGLLLLFLVFSVQITSAQKKTKPQPAAPKALKAAVTLEKANAIYVGIENPITISAGSASAAEIAAICKKGGVKVNDAGQQVLQCDKPGLDTLVVTAPDGTSERFPFRLKKMPDPVAKLNGQFIAGAISVEELRSCNEVKAVFEALNYDPKCVISGFNFTFIPKKQEPVSLVCTSAKFDTKVAEQIVKAKAGDYVMFSNITTKCQGDITARTIAPLFFTVK
jgi:GldM C-terminal domain